MKSRLIGAVVASSALLFSMSAQAYFLGPISGQGTWETTLQARDLDGNPNTVEAYYDTALNITWLANANAAVGSIYDTYSYHSGQLTWSDANAWAHGLNIGGVTGWRLPTAMDTGAPGCDFAYSGTDCGYNVDTTTGEMAHLFYVTLGNVAMYSPTGASNPPGYGVYNSGPFANLQTGPYWSGTPYAPDASQAWLFNFGTGIKYHVAAGTHVHAWAVHAGDVAALPAPASVYLFSAGLLGLFWFGRRQAA